MCRPSLGATGICGAIANRINNRYQVTLVLDYVLDLLLVTFLSALFNVVPVFAPPTWALLAYFHTEQSIGLIVVVLLGAIGSTSGRVMLALVSRRVGVRIVPARRREDLEQAVRHIQERKALGLPALALFAVGPVPKALLFMAAGIARAPLMPAAAVYGTARAGMYLGTLLAVDASMASVGSIFSFGSGGTLILAAQAASIVGFFALLRLDLRGLLSRSTLFVSRCKAKAVR